MTFFLQKNILINCGISIKNAIKLASFNSAKLLVIDNNKGVIKVGAEADLYLINDSLNVYLTIVQGIIKYENLS